MAWRSKGFSIHVDGREVHYGAGREVPEDLAETLGLAARGLVETDGADVSGGLASAPSTDDTEKPKKKKRGGK